MKLVKYLSSLIKPELDFLETQLNLTAEETEVFNCLKKGKTINEISMQLNISDASVNRNIEKIKSKIERVIQYEQNSDKR